MRQPPRKYGPFSQVLVEHKLPTGHIIYMPYVEDLSNEHLQEAFVYWLDRQDYEYLSHLSAEATRRGFKLKM